MKGYCNCKSDKLHYGKKSTTVEVVRDTYHEVRVDTDGLCYLCANTALHTKPEPRVKNNDCNRALKPADLSINPDNPDGIFMVREDESADYEPKNFRESYDSNGLEIIKDLT